MAVPKRKTTKSRAGKRRSHIKFSSKNVIEDNLRRVEEDNTVLKSRVEQLEQIIAAGIRGEEVDVGDLYGALTIFENNSFKIYYKNVSDEGVIKYYQTIIEEVASNDLKYVLYNIPKVSGVEINFKILECFLRFTTFLKVFERFSKFFERFWTFLERFCTFSYGAKTN